MEEKQPKLIVTPKFKKDRKNARLMEQIINWELDKIMTSSLKSPFQRAVTARAMSMLLFGRIEEEYVKQKQDEFLKLYKESVAPERHL